MKSFALSDARRDLPTLVDKSAKEPILITRHGEEAAVMISPSLYEQMIEAMEELEDIAGLRLFRSGAFGLAALRFAER